jgi:hypothetical protein
MDTRYPLFELALAGIHATAHRSTLSGCGRDWARTCAEHAEEGAVLIDKSGLEGDPRLVGWVINDPMVDPSLPDGAERKCPEMSGVMADAMAVSGNAYGALVNLKRAGGDDWKGMDDCSLAAHVARWRSRGARIGHYRSGAVSWDS